MFALNSIFKYRLGIVVCKEILSGSNEFKAFFLVERQLADA